MNSNNVRILEKFIRSKIFFAIPESLKRCLALGIKHDELGHNQNVWKARCVFQGSNVRTKTETSAADLFEETSNALVSFAAMRAALAVDAMRGFNASL